MVFRMIFGNTLLAAGAAVGCLALLYQNYGVYYAAAAFFGLHFTGQLPPKYFPGIFQFVYKIYCSEVVGFKYLRTLMHPRQNRAHSNFASGIRVLGMPNSVSPKDVTGIMKCQEGILIVPVPMFTDNYSYLVICNASDTAAVVDPADPGAVRSAVNTINTLTGRSVKLTHILTTHKHWDHAGGNKELLDINKDLVIVGSEADAPHCTNYTVKDGDEMSIGNNIKVRVLASPGHTAGSVLFVVGNSSSATSSSAFERDQLALFTGDCIFCGGCGAMFETKDTSDVLKTYDQFYKPDSFHSFSAKATTATTSSSTSPVVVDDDNVLVYVGHEYSQRLFEEMSQRIDRKTTDPTEKNCLLRYTEVCAYRKSFACTIPSTLTVEKGTNPLLTLDRRVLQQMEDREKKGAAVSVSDIEYAIYMSKSRREDVPRLVAPHISDNSVAVGPGIGGTSATASSAKKEKQ